MQQALLLDKNYMALSLVPWKKALKLMVKGKAEPVIGSGIIKKISSQTGFEVPSIIRLLVVIPWRAHIGKLRFSRRNVFIRDNFNCQYCGIKVGKMASTLDHVVPRSRGGKTDYINCVTCCKACNNVKADRTPIEADMKLLRKPGKPSFVDLYGNYMNDTPQEWNDYIIGL